VAGLLVIPLLCAGLERRQAKQTQPHENSRKLHSRGSCQNQTLATNITLTGISRLCLTTISLSQRATPLPHQTLTLIQDKVCVPSALISETRIAWPLPVKTEFYRSLTVNGKYIAPRHLTFVSTFTAVGHKSLSQRSYHTQAFLQSVNAAETCKNGCFYSHHLPQQHVPLPRASRCSFLSPTTTLPSNSNTVFTRVLPPPKF
jgi:hypothetical protein